MYLTEKLKIFFGWLLCADDHSECKVVSECSLMLQKRTLVTKLLRHSYLGLVHIPNSLPTISPCLINLTNIINSKNKPSEKSLSIELKCIFFN